jgi:hypothetical protein
MSYQTYATHWFCGILHRNFDQLRLTPPDVDPMDSALPLVFLGSICLKFQHGLCVI